MKLLFISIFSLVAISARAELNGAWKGLGKINYDGWKANCEKVALKIEQNEKTLKLQSTKYSCDMLDVEDGDYDFAIVNGDLQLQGQKVGTVTDSKIHFEFYNDDSHMNEVHDLARSGKELTFTEKWVNKEGGTFLDLQSSLKLE